MKTLTRIVSAFAMSWGLSTAAWAQLPPGPMPSPTPLPAPTPIDPNSAPGALPPGAPIPGPIGPGGTCSPGSCGTCLPKPIIPGGCLDWLLPRCGCGGGNWFVGGGVYYMAPFYNSNPAYSTSKTVGTGTANSAQSYGPKMSVAPLAFAGYTWDSGWGIRFRWFQFSQDNSAGTTLDGATTVADAGGQRSVTPITPGAVVATDSHLYLSAYDLEATYLATFGNWTLLGSAGARYAQINQNYSFSAIDPGIPVNTLTSYASHNFNGFGPTMSIEGHYQIGGSDFGLYGTARGSILFGAGSVSSTAVYTVVAEPTVGGSARQTSVIPVGEIEFGGEWNHCCGRFRFFAQIGVVGQIWWGAGNPSQGLNMNGDNVSPSNIGSAASPANLGFIGGVARAGITF